MLPEKPSSASEKQPIRYDLTAEASHQRGRAVVAGPLSWGHADGVGDGGDGMGLAPLMSSYQRYAFT